MVTVPVRIPVDEFGSTDTLTIPLSEPEAPDVIEIQLALLLAVQSQKFESRMETLPVPPLTPKFMLEVDSENPQLEPFPP